MPFKAGKSPKQALQELSNKLDKISGNRLEIAMRKVMYLIGGKADQYVPIDTSALIDGRKIRVQTNGKGRIRGVLGYYEDYAMILHSPAPGSKMDGWNPRPPGAPGKRSNGYNPQAKQGWIDIGFKEVWPEQVKAMFMKELNKK